MCTTPIFRPEMMFSYFTLKLQLLGDNALGLLGSTTKYLHFLVGNITIVFNLFRGFVKQRLFYAYSTLQRCSSLNKKSRIK